MEEEHEVLLEQSELGIVRQRAGFGPRGRTLDPRLLRLIPVLWSSKPTRDSAGKRRAVHNFGGNGAHKPVVRLLGVELLLLLLVLALRS